MTVFPARKRASLSSLHCRLCLCRCVVLHVSCPHAESVACPIRDTIRVSLRCKKKAKIYISTKENDKNNSNAQWHALVTLI